MNRDILGVLFVVAMSAVVWLAGFGHQKTNNRTNDQDYSVRSRRVWTYLFGMRPGIDKIYLRPAGMQVLGWLFLFLGLFAVVNDGTDGTRPSLVWVIVIAGGGLLIGLAWAIIDVLRWNKDRKKHN